MVPITEIKTSIKVHVRAHTRTHSSHTRRGVTVKAMITFAGCICLRLWS